MPTLQEIERIDCCPELCDQTICESAPKNCIYTPSEVEGVPWCYVNKYVSEIINNKFLPSINLLVPGRLIPFPHRFDM